MEFEKLKQNALLVGKYYCKGFGNALEGVNCNVEGHISYPDRGYDAISRRIFQRIEDFYTQIPLFDLHDEIFHPLFVVDRLLPSYKDIMNQTLEKRKQIFLTDLIHYSTAIIIVGNLYRKSFREILEQVRAIDKNFSIQLVDLEGKLWDQRVI